MITLGRETDILDVELFESGWLQVFAYADDYQADRDKPSEPTLVLEDAVALAAECRT